MALNKIPSYNIYYICHLGVHWEWDTEPDMWEAGVLTTIPRYPYNSSCTLYPNNITGSITDGHRHWWKCPCPSTAVQGSHVNL